MYLKVRSVENDFPFYVDENLAEKFPLWWCSEPQNILGPEVISPRNVCLIEFLVEGIDRKDLISMYELLKWEDDKEAVINYLGEFGIFVVFVLTLYGFLMCSCVCIAGGKYPGVSIASLRSRFKSKNLEKEVSSSNREKVATPGEVVQPHQGRRKVIVRKRKSGVVDLSDESSGKEEKVSLEKIRAFVGNQKKLHEMSKLSEGVSVWGKEYPYMAVVDEHCQSEANVSLAKEVGEVAIGQYMQVRSFLWFRFYPS